MFDMNIFAKYASRFFISFLLFFSSFGIGHSHIVLFFMAYGIRAVMLWTRHFNNIKFENLMYSVRTANERLKTEKYDCKNFFILYLVCSISPVRSVRFMLLVVVFH